MFLGRTSRGIGCLVLAAGLVFTAGCGSEPATAPKQELSEKEKQQLKELDEQRQKEWSGGGSGS